MQDLGLMNNAFNDFFIKLNKNIVCLLKFYHGNHWNHLKSVESLMHAVVRNLNSKHVHLNESWFRLDCSYIVVQITFSIFYEKTLQSK